MSPDRRWRLWLAVTVVGFALLEMLGLVTDEPGDTLSERLRHWGGLTDDTPTRTARTALAVGLTLTTLTAVWLPGHIYGWWP